MTSDYRFQEVVGLMEGNLHVNLSNAPISVNQLNTISQKLNFE